MKAWWTDFIADFKKDMHREKGEYRTVVFSFVKFAISIVLLIFCIYAQRNLINYEAINEWDDHALAYFVVTCVSVIFVLLMVTVFGSLLNVIGIIVRNLFGDVSESRPVKAGKKVLLIASSIVLLVFPAGMIIYTQIHFAHVDEAEADIVTAHYEKYVSFHLSRNSSSYLYFSDHKRIETRYLTESALEKIHNLPVGTELTLLLHPRNGLILGIWSGNDAILRYDDVVHKFDMGRNVFLVLFLLMYVFYAFLFLISSEGKAFLKGRNKKLKDRIKDLRKWDPLICRPQDVIDLCEECIRIDAPVLKLFIDYNGEKHTVGVSSYTSGPAAPPTDIRYFLDDSEFETVEEFKEGAAIYGKRFMDMEYVTVLEDELTGNPRGDTLLKEREIKLENLDIYHTVKKYVDEYDFYNLLKGGAPNDEYDSESERIASQITTESTVEEIENVISAVMEKSFAVSGDNLPPQSSKNYLEISEKIKDEITRSFCSEEIAKIFLDLFPEYSEAYQNHIQEYGRLQGHIFYADVVNVPLCKLFEDNGDDAIIRRYCEFVEHMWRRGNNADKNVVDVTILEGLSDDKVRWQRFGTFISDEFKAYINNELLKENYMMAQVPLLED